MTDTPQTETQTETQAETPIETPTPATTRSPRRNRETIPLPTDSSDLPAGTELGATPVAGAPGTAPVAGAPGTAPVAGAPGTAPVAGAPGVTPAREETIVSTNSHVVDGLRLRMKVWTDPTTNKRYLASTAFMTDPQFGLLTVYALSDEDTKMIKLTRIEWNMLPFFFFKEEGPAPRATARVPDALR